MTALRIEKVNEHIREELGVILVKEAELKVGVFVTIVKVETTSNLRMARVAISVFPETEAVSVQNILARTTYRIQRALNSRLHMRPMPMLLFELDTTAQSAQRIEEVLIALQKERDISN